jgi:hypothetical protein
LREEGLTLGRGGLLDVFAEDGACQGLGAVVGLLRRTPMTLVWLTVSASVCMSIVASVGGPWSIMRPGARRMG